MYEAFYGFNEKPFNLTPDPRFLFLSEKHREAFAHLLYGIKNRTGFIMVSGEIGTGKTTICRSLLSQIDPDTEIAFIFNPCLSPLELLKNINADFGIESYGETALELIAELNRYLMERSAQGKNCVLVIDEAQNLQPGVLEQIRLLSNLETETQKLLQIILIGQPELNQNLQLPELRQLNQRITARYHLKALDQEETLQYIAHRINTAGGRRKVQFAPGAVKAVYRFSEGTPRVINAICDRALLIGYTKEMRTITTALVKQAAKEIRGETAKAKRASARTLFRKLLPSPSLVVTALVIVLLVKYIAPMQLPFMQSGLTGGQSSMAASNEMKQTGPTPLEKAAQDEAKPPGTTVPAVETVPVPAPVPAEPVLAKRLTQVTPETARRAALAAMLRAWNMAVLTGFPAGDDPASIAQFAVSNGLACEKPAPSLDAVTAIGLPALMKMKSGEQTVWVALLGVEGDRFKISTDGPETITVPREELRDSFANEALVFWRDSRPESRALKEQMEGPDVLDLQAKLRSLNRLSGEKAGLFDEATKRAVLNLQLETGINVDGVAGKQVRMVLASRFPEGPTPSLQEKKTAETTSTPLQPESITSPEMASIAVNAAQERQPAETATLSEDSSPEEAAPVVEAPKGSAGPIVLSETPNETEASDPMRLLPILFDMDAGDEYTDLPLGLDRGINAESLPAPLKDDTLGPPKTAPVKEVTPPLSGNTPLTPRTDGSG